ncbi:MAG: hypothetical protein WCH05_10860 [Chlorobiaceae bacterium]
MRNPARNKRRTDRALKNWRAKIEEQLASGQEPGAFCRQRNICSSGFYAWRKRLGMKGSVVEPVVKSPRLLPGALKPLPRAGFLRLDPAGAAVLRDPEIEQHSRVMWIDTPGGYRVAVNGGVGLAEVFGLLRSL